MCFGWCTSTAMGSTETKVQRISYGKQIDPNRSPKFIHSITKSPHGGNSRQSKNRIDESLSVVKVCRTEAHSVERKLRKEYFSKWNEECRVDEYHGFGLSQTEELISMISDNLAINKDGISKKLHGIKFCRTFDVKIMDFMFEDKFKSGIIHFGMVAISKENNVLNASSCLYTLELEKAEELVIESTTIKLLGFRLWTNKKCRRETKSLEFVTRQDLENFCRYKALVEFNKRNLVSKINDVSSLNFI